MDFSFSGLKTSILYKIQKEVEKDPDFIKKNLEDLCASIQHAIVSVLIEKLQKAIQQTGIKQIAIAGGVSANTYLREQLELLAKIEKFSLYIPKFEYCTDNAAMIAMAAHYYFKKNKFVDLNITPNPRLHF